IYDNGRFGFFLAANPTEVPVQAEVHRNQTVDNIIGVDPLGNPAPNLFLFPPGGDYAPGGSDFTWSETGNDNCWGPQDPSSGPTNTDPPMIPGPCPSPNTGLVLFPPPAKLPLLTACLLNEVPPGSGNFHTADVPYPCPWGQTNDAPYQSRDEAECG